MRLKGRAMKTTIAALVIGTMTTIPAQTKIPTVDRNAPANVQTATFALG